MEKCYGMKLILDLKVQSRVPSKQWEALPSMKLIKLFLLVLHFCNRMHDLILVAAQMSFFILFIAILLLRIFSLLQLELLYKSPLVAIERHRRAAVEQAVESLERAHSLRSTRDLWEESFGLWLVGCVSERFSVIGKVNHHVFNSIIGEVVLYSWNALLKYFEMLVVNRVDIYPIVELRIGSN